MQDGYILSNACAIYYDVQGEGSQEILFLHGNGEDRRIFDSISRKLYSKYRIYRMDSRGHGKSSYVPGTLSIAQMAEDTVQVMQELNLNRPHLVGFSDGANVAMQVAIQHSDMIGKLVLVGGNLYPDGLLPHILFQMKAQERYLKLKKRMGISVEKDLELLFLMTKEPNISPENLRRIQNATLVIAGEHDMIRRSHTYLIAKAIPNAVLRIIPDGDHFVFTRRLNRLMEILLPFLEKGDRE